MERGKVRRTQIERRAQTRAALLDATVACLVERGYSRTSTNDIIRLAGVSRGALLHHFASKAELMGEAVAHVFDRCEMEFRESFAELPVEQRTLEVAVRRLWDIFRGPVYDAALELQVAARTDPELKVSLRRVIDRLERNVAADFGVMFPGTATNPEAVRLVRFTFAVLEGAAITQDMGKDDYAEEVVEMLVGLAAAVDQAPPVLPPPPTEKTDKTDKTDKTENVKVIRVDTVKERI